MRFWSLPRNMKYSVDGEVNVHTTSLCVLSLMEVCIKITVTWNQNAVRILGVGWAVCFSGTGAKEQTASTAVSLQKYLLTRPIYRNKSQIAKRLHYVWYILHRI